MNMMTKVKTNAKSFLLIILGSLVFAAGINLIVIPNQLSEGGVTGISIITYYYFKWSPGITNLVLNILLMFVGYHLLDKRTMLYTIVGVVFCSLFLYLIPTDHAPFTEDTLLAAIFAGLLVGIGIGLVFSGGGTTGGAAIIVRLMEKYLGWGLGNAMLIVDLIVIFASSFMIGLEKTMYTMIAVYLGARMVDYIVEGFNSKRAITIISTEAGRISAGITGQLQRGATILHGQGAFTKQEKNVLYVVLQKQEIMDLKELVQEIDPEAFIVIHEVHEVLGKGFSIVK